MSRPAESFLPFMSSILICDDTPENVVALRRILARDGHDVRTVSQGALAASSAAAAPPDIILLDVLMPDLDGYETCALLQADERTHDIPVLFISALDDMPSKLRGFEVGGRDYIAKPFRAEEVLARVRTHLALRKAERQLVEQNAALRAATALQKDVERMLRHDLRVSLAGVIGFSELIVEELPLDHPCAAHARIVAGAGYGMLSMVHGSFDLLKMERGTYALHAEAFDLAAVARQVVAEHTLAAREKDVRIRFEFAHEGDEDALASGERLLTHSLLGNLVRNAVEATPAGGVIDLRFGGGEGRAEVAVRNVGEVPPEIRARFFEKFVTSGKAEGTGLGTYSARLMAETQHGTLALDASEPGHTTLRVSLPAPDAAAAAAFRRARDGYHAAAPEAAGVVLVADDDGANRAYLRRILPSPPLDVRFAADGREALAALQREPVAVALLDVEMPGLNGMEVIHEFCVWRSEQAKPIPTPVFIGISGHHDAASRKKFLEAGFDRVLGKPLARRRLHEELRAALRTGRPVVQLDPMVRELLPDFLASQGALLDEAAALATAGDTPRLRSLAHRLRGSFAMYGFAVASALANNAEEAARAGDLRRAASLLADLRAHLAALDIRFGS